MEGVFAEFARYLTARERDIELHLCDSVRGTCPLHSFFGPPRPLVSPPTCRVSPLRLDLSPPDVRLVPQPVSLVPQQLYRVSRRGCVVF